MFRPHIALSLFVATAGSAAAASPSPDPQSLAVPAKELSHARALVQQLGSEQFPDREKAEFALAEMGRLARLALLEGANTDPNPEVRTRCAGLLPKAIALDIKARLDVFLADTDGKFEHELPGWNQFRAAVRNDWTFLGHTLRADRSLDRAARAVFAETISTPANRAVVMAVGGPANELGHTVAARRQELYAQKYPRAIIIGGVLIQPAKIRRDPSSEDMLALLFAESLAPAMPGRRTTSVTALISASGFTNEVRDADEKGKVYRAVATAWLESRKDPIEMYQAMSTASTLGLPDQAVRIALRLFNSAGTPVTYRGLAASTLARLGKKEHIPLLETSLGDAGVMTNIRRPVVKDGKSEIVNYEVQNRDVALAVSVLLSGQKLDDYGFVDLLKASGAVGQTYTYTRHHLPEDKRKAALEKWKDWRAKNP